MLFEQAPEEGKKISLLRSHFLGLSHNANWRGERALAYCICSVSFRLPLPSLFPEVLILVPRIATSGKVTRSPRFTLCILRLKSDNLIGREFEATSLCMYRNLDLGTKDCWCLTKEAVPLTNVISSDSKLRPLQLAFMGGDGLYLCICSDYHF